MVGCCEWVDVEHESIAEYVDICRFVDRLLALAVASNANMLMPPGDNGGNRSIVLLAQVALQFSVNCVTGNETSQAVVWGLYFPDHFQVSNPCFCFMRGGVAVNVLALTCLMAGK